MNNKMILSFLFVITAFLFLPSQVTFFQTDLSGRSKNNEVYNGKFISSVEFEGNKNISSKELIDIFNYEDDIAGVVNGLFVYPYKKAWFDYAVKNEIKNLFQSRGFMNVSVDEIKVIEDGNFIKLNIPIEEGAISRFGKIKIVGAKAFSSGEIEAFLDFKQGQIINFIELRKKVFEELPKLYGIKGFANCNIEYENISKPTISETGESVVDFDILIDEGKISRIKQINVVGDAVKNQFFHSCS